MTFIKNIFRFIFSKRFLVHLGLLVMFYLIVMIGTIYYLNIKTNHGHQIEVKDYVGQNVNQITSDLQQNNIQYEVVDSIYDPSKPVGTILFQRPLPTKISDVYIKQGRKLFFRVSKKTKLIELPILIEKSERYAIAVLNNLGLKYTINYVSSTEAIGAVVEQTYNGNTVRENQKVPINATIKLSVGQSYDQVKMQVPNLSCLTINDVEARLRNNPGVKILENYIGCHTKQDSLNARVIFQNPPFGEDQMILGSSTIAITLDLNNNCDE